MGARFLFVGDIHLGRRPTRLPADLAEHGVDPAELTPAAAWRRTVDEALALAERGGLAAVVLAGDVVEGMDDRFEAYAHLADGVRRLTEAGIPVCGVAGNHDVNALPRLARQVPDFHLLGADGRWESVAFDAGGVRVDLLGWSFPERRVRHSPLAAFAPDPRPGAATLGVLHCDLDAGRSEYAPVARGELEGTAVDAWLLGHVHAPGALEGTRPIGYLGSLVGLDPGEPHAHGPWLVHVDGPGAVRAEQRVLAPLRWEREIVELDDAALERGDSPRDAVFGAMLEGLRRAWARAEAEQGDRPLRALGGRLVLRGRLRRRDAVRAAVHLREAWPREPFEGGFGFVETVIDETRPALDLATLARGGDPPALLAKHLLSLDGEAALDSDLVVEAARRFDAVRGQGRWRALDEAPAEGEPGPDARAEARDRLRRTALDLLEALLAQRDAAVGAEARP